MPVGSGRGRPRRGGFSRRLAGAHAAAHAASPARARAAAVHGAVRRAAVVVVVDALPERDDALGVQVDACDDGRRAEEFASESEPRGESRVESHAESSDVRGWRRAASVEGEAHFAAAAAAAAAAGMELGVGEPRLDAMARGGARQGHWKIAPVTSHKLHGEPCTGLAFVRRGC